MKIPIKLFLILSIFAVVFLAAGCEDKCKVGDVRCSPDNKIVQTCTQFEGFTDWMNTNDCSGVGLACQDGACVVKANVAEYNMNEGSDLLVLDSSGNDNHGRRGKEGLSNSEPVWTATTPFGTGYALSFEKMKRHHVRINMTPSLRGLGNNLENSMTVEAWVKPDTAAGTQVQKIVHMPFMFSLQQRYNNDRTHVKYEFLIAIDGQAEKFLNGQPFHYDWLRTPWMPVTEEWRHVAATYDALNMEMSIYINNELKASRVLTDIATSHEGISSLETDLPYYNPPSWWDQVTMDEEIFDGWQYMTIGSSMPRFDKYPPQLLFKGIMDDVKIYDFVKTCFDIDGDENDDCICPGFEMAYEINAEAASVLPEENICPSGEDVKIAAEYVEVYRNDGSGNFTILMSEGDQLCAGEPLTLVYSKLGKYPVTTTAYGCDYSCYEDCSESCMNVFIQDCLRQCDRRCANSVCRDWGETICGGEGGEQVTYCTYVFSHSGGEYDTTECYDVTLNPDWEGEVCNDICRTECTSSLTEHSVTYDEYCGYGLAEIFELWKGSSGCTGNLVITSEIGGYGTTTLMINVPNSTGMHTACLNGQEVGKVQIKEWGSSGCEITQENACTLELSPDHISVNPSEKGTTVTATGTITNIGDAPTPQGYELKIYAKYDGTDTKDSFRGAKPLKLSLVNDKIPKLEPGDSTTFEITYGVPLKPYKKKVCEKKFGKAKPGCEVDTKDRDNQRYYPSIIVRANEAGAGEGYCEASFSIDHTPACVDEICGDYEDNDCDDIIDEAIIAVEVVNHSARGSPEPYVGAVVNFYEYVPPKGMPNNANGDECIMLGTKPWHFQEIVDTCKPHGNCTTDEDGYCQSEVPTFANPDHYMTIATVEGLTQPHLGIPVSAVKCGKIKKTWHLQYKVHTCTIDADCPSANMVCQDEVCVDCKTNADCATDEVCDAGACVAT